MRLFVKPQEVCQRHQAGQEIRGSVGEGPAVSLRPHANADKRSTNPTPFSLKLTRLHTINGLPTHQARFVRKIALFDRPICTALTENKSATGADRDQSRRACPELVEGDGC